MDKAQQVERLKTPDDRWSERHINESVDPLTGDKVREITVYTQPVVDLELEKTIIEKIRDEVYERTINFVDKDGKIIEQKVEYSEPASSRMQVVEHIVSRDEALRRMGMTYASDDSETSVITKEELKNLFVEAINANKCGNCGKTKNYVPEISSKKAQSARAKVVEKIDEDNKSTNWVLWILGIVAAVEIIFVVGSVMF